MITAPGTITLHCANLQRVEAGKCIKHFAHFEPYSHTRIILVFSYSRSLFIPPDTGVFNVPHNIYIYINLNIITVMFHFMTNLLSICMLTYTSYAGLIIIEPVENLDLVAYSGR